MVIFILAKAERQYHGEKTSFLRISDFSRKSANLHKIEIFSENLDRITGYSVSSFDKTAQGGCSPAIEKRAQRSSPCVRFPAGFSSRRTNRVGYKNIKQHTESFYTFVDTRTAASVSAQSVTRSRIQKTAAKSSSLLSFRLCSRRGISKRTSGILLSNFITGSLNLNAA